MDVFYIRAVGIAVLSEHFNLTPVFILCFSHFSSWRYTISSEFIWHSWKRKSIRTKHKSVIWFHGDNTLSRPANWCFVSDFMTAWNGTATLSVLRQVWCCLSLLFCGGSCDVCECGEVLGQWDPLLSSSYTVSSGWYTFGCKGPTDKCKSINYPQQQIVLIKTFRKLFYYIAKIFQRLIRKKWVIFILYS